MPVTGGAIRVVLVDLPHTELVVRVVRGDGAIHGTVAFRDRPAERFTGWLEFTAAVARLLPKDDAGVTDRPARAV